MMRSLRTIVASLLITVAFSARCQDLVAVAPQAAKVEYEDARIRVVRLHIGANETLPVHDRPARVVIPLTANDVITARPDGTKSNVRVAAGQVAWSEPSERSVTNLAGPLENIIVELKKTDGPAKPLPHPPSPPPTGYLDEPLHHWLFENQYVRVYDVRIPPGVTTGFHVHAFDSVSIQMSGGLTSSQTQGHPWGQLQKSESGSVVFRADSKQPRTHRVRNEGTTEYHVVVVQLLE